MDKSSPSSSSVTMKPAETPQEKENIRSSSAEEPSFKDSAPPQENNALTRGRSTLPFPWKLHEMLTGADAEGYADIVSWLPDSNAFRVHQPKAFVEKVMPRYFHQTRYTSFQRQLNIWGFRRLGNNGPRKGGYSNENFVRMHPEFCHQMKRVNHRVKKQRQRLLKIASEPAMLTQNSYLTGSPMTVVLSSPDLMQRNQDNTNLRGCGVTMLQKNFQNAGGIMLSEHHRSSNFHISPTFTLPPGPSTCPSTFHDLFDDETLLSVLPESFFKNSSMQEDVSEAENTIQQTPCLQADQNVAVVHSVSPESIIVEPCPPGEHYRFIPSPSTFDAMNEATFCSRESDSFGLHRPEEEGSYSSMIPTVVSVGTIL